MVVALSLRAHASSPQCFIMSPLPDLKRSWCELESWLEKLDDALKGGVVIVLIDACRSNPTSRMFMSARGRDGSGKLASEGRLDE